MYAQRQSHSNPSYAARGRPAFNRPAVRARVGLLMRRGAHFGEIEEAEQAMRAAGLGLAPVSAGSEPLIENGMTLMATATLADLDSGALRALIVPDSAGDDVDVAEVARRALTAGLPVLVFGSSIAAVALAAEVPAPDAPAAVFTRDGAQALSHARDLSGIAEAIR